VSLPEIERIRAKLIEAGALGSKISGAGLGGSIVAIFESKAEAIRALGEGWRARVTSIDSGPRIEQ
jgi:Mevalonate kinase